MNTVYILGAGASKHAGFPLIADMGKQWFEWMDTYPGGRYQDACNLLKDVFGSAPNIEDVITEVESLIDSLANSEDQERKLERTLLGNTYGRLNESLREWFRELSQTPAIAYSQFAENIIQQGDVFITFNYDDALERALRRANKWDLSRGYGFALGKENIPSPTLVLKLHGSINWLGELFNGVVSGPLSVGSDLSLGNQPVIHKADAQDLGYSDFTGRTYRGGGAIVSIILPGRNKKFFYSTSLGIEWKEFFDDLWRQAEEKLKLAERLIICGYGMMPADNRACDMILNAPCKKVPVQIISGNQSEQIAREFKKAGYTNVSTHPTGYFEDWVNTFSSW